MHYIKITFGYIKITFDYIKITFGHIKITFDYIKSTLGHIKITFGYIKITFGHIRIKFSYIKISMVPLVLWRQRVDACKRLRETSGTASLPQFNAIPWTPLQTASICITGSGLTLV